MILIFGIAFAVFSFAIVIPASAWHQIVIPYAYVGDNWDSVIVVSNISGKTINPLIVVRNFNEGSNVACFPLGELEEGEIYSNTFGAITGWCPGWTPPIPGIFQVFVAAAELDSSDNPFGVAIAINNASFGGFGFQQYKSESSSISGVFLSCTCEP
ncbi:MAG: hypothetical protein RBS57_20945 [Desulforhabdus sp.]|nr:hypothetical protein [Desulforhabdus sp.]